MDSFSKKINIFRIIQVTLLTIIFVLSPIIPQKNARATGGYKIPHIISFNGATSIGDNYYPIVNSRGSGSSVEANVQFYVTKAGTFTGLSALVSVANNSGDTTFTFRKNGADGNNTITIPQSNSGFFQDTTNSDTVVPGDLINMQISHTAGNITLHNMVIFFEADDGSTTNFIMAAGTPAGFPNNNTVRYVYPVGVAQTTIQTESIVQTIINNDSVLSNFAVYISGNARTTTTTFRVRKNGANASQISVTAGVTGLRRNTTTTNTFTAGDLFNFAFSTFGGGNNIDIRNFQATLTSDNPREITYMGGSNFVRSSTAAAIWISPIGGLGTNSSTETQQRMFIGSNGTISKFGIFVSTNASNRDMDIRLRINGNTGNNTVTNPQTTTGWFQDTTSTDDITGTDTIAFRSLVNSGGTGTGNVTYTSTTFLFTLPDTAIEQSAYRFFENDNSTDVGTPLNTQDTPATLSASGEAFRLRLLLHVSNSDLGISGANFKLQFAEKSGTCDTSFSGETYADITGGTLIAYNDNASPSDGNSLTSNANDPAHGADTITNQSYEELNNFTNSVSAIPDGQDGKWDFSLIDNGATPNTSYCFRAVKSDGSTLDTYSTIPEIVTAAGGGALSVDIVDAGSTPVPTPSVAMSGINFSFTDQTSTGSFGTSSEKIRVNNGTGTATWTLSLAADDGPTAFWDSASADYDFNDTTAGALDGADADSLGGQMTIDASSATITPEGGCTLTNISSGATTSFSEGVTDSITIASAASGADTNCYWDITDIDISQTIPPEQAADSYSIDMTLSIIAS